MRKIAFVLLCLFLGQHIAAQDPLEHQRLCFEINAKVLAYPRRFSRPEQLAERIRKDFQTERAQAQAIYAWMGFNIRYDVKKLRNPPRLKPIKYKTQEELLVKQKKRFDDQVNKTLRSRKGICGDYSAVYFSVANLLGLHCEITNGNAKNEKYDIGKKRAIIDHAWNSVQIDGEWKLLDVTWGAGYLDEETDKFVPNFTLFYFDTPKEFFFANHYPEKGEWHDIQIDKKKFLDGPLLFLDSTSSYKIMEPNTGVIAIKKGAKLKFSIANVTEEVNVKYSLKADDEMKEVTEKEVKDDQLTFEIIIDDKIGRYLTLFINDEPVAMFRINKTKT